MGGGAHQTQYIFDQFPHPCAKCTDEDRNGSHNSGQVSDQEGLAVDRKKKKTQRGFVALAPTPYFS